MAPGGPEFQVTAGDVQSILRKVNPAERALTVADEGKAADETFGIGVRHVRYCLCSAETASEKYGNRRLDTHR